MVKSSWAAVLVLACAGTARAQFVEPEARVLRTFEGAAAGDAFGFIGVAVGDLDGDGVAELALSAPSHPAPATPAGRVTVYSGATGAVLATHEGTGVERLGRALAPVGDVDRDGVGDYVVGAPGLPGRTPPLPGRVTVHSGRTHAALWRREGAPSSLFGTTAAGVGDVTGDGLPDVLVGAPRWPGAAGPTAGRVVLLSGRDGAPVWHHEGPDAAGLMGTAAGALGADVSGDGVPDVVAGARNAGPSQGGRVELLSGKDGTLLRALVPEPTAGDFGWFFATGMGDLNRDGAPDVLVGDFQDGSVAGSPGDGRTYVFSGKDGARLVTLAAEHPQDGFGVARPAGDVDFDGVPDFLVGAYTASATVLQGGKVYLYSGRGARVLRTWTGTRAGEGLGYDNVAVGDVNGDGRVDFLLTAASSTTAPGRAYLVAGLPAPCPADLTDDRVVDGRDVRTLATLMGTRGGPADLDGSGTVDAGDVRVMNAARGRCPA